MQACVLQKPAKIETNPLVYVDAPAPEPAAGELLVRVKYCGVCRTDLHVIEGELPQRKSPIIPGHQVVGTVEKFGEKLLWKRSAGAPAFAVGARVGIAWLHHTDGTCQFCRTGAENLCDDPAFTGYTVDGGYAEYIVAPQDFVYAIPEQFPDEQAAPLLCAGIIGFRSLRLSGIQPGGKLALELGAKWAGGTLASPPEKLDAAIVFAPAGEIVPAALAALRKGGTLVLDGIHMSPIPSFDYDLLYEERMIRSVANNTREDGRDFLQIAAQIPIRTHVQLFPLREANRALNALKNDAIHGAAVLKVEA